MQSSATIAIVAGVFLASCTDTSGILGSDAGHQMVNSSVSTPDLKSSDAVYFQVKGQSNRQSIGTLEDDGAICSGSVCSWSSIQGHAQASTSEVYIESVERMKLAEMGASKLPRMDW
ncbi:hypothetical protein RUE5091_00593 [Ruegeria denitrificans]|uniref:Uncharacterized protein n=1 Tax=Ruegeria denitrificans TaxID=1715692 RepID=A0A0P1I3G4_9RHOB|nr:hypothetical protein RUE5091_00593 [Ruegeria denitrificans]